MKKTKDGRKLYSREFKIAAIQRVEQGERQATVARKLKVHVTVLARWRRQFHEGGLEGLGEIGRRMQHANREQENARLERLVGRQEAAIDFLEQALRHIEGLRRSKKGNGVTASSK